MRDLSGTLQDLARRSPFGVWLGAFGVCAPALLLLVAVWALFPQSRPGPGAIKLQIAFPQTPTSGSEPIVVTGGTGSADFVYVRYLNDGTLMFFYDSWGVGGPHSEPLHYASGHPYELDVDMPSLHPGPSRSELLIKWDGREVLHANVSAHLGGPTSLGKNPAGGTVCSGRFSGTIVPVAGIAHKQRWIERVIEAARLDARKTQLLLLGAAFVSFVFVFFFQSSRPARSLFLRKAGYRCTPLLVSALALAPLIDANLRWEDSDWNNHQWLVAYYSNYFASHLRFPAVLNTAQFIGMAHTVFYGDLLYGLIGAVAAVVGVDVATRLILLLALAIQFIFVRKLVTAMSRTPLLGNTVATLVTWQIYPLSNLYSRGAITEFLAVCFLNATACCIIEIAFRGARGGERLMALRLAGLLVLAMACHPITLLFGAICLSGLALGCIIFTKRRLEFLRIMCFAGTMCGFAMAPWIYVMSKYAPELDVVRRTYGQGAWLIYFGFDRLWTRLAFFPWSLGITAYPLPRGFTPYLDAQANTPLLFLTVALCLGICLSVWNGRTERARPVAKSRGSRPLVAYLAGLGFIVFTGALWLSVGHHSVAVPIWGFPLSYANVQKITNMPRFLSLLQFAYRLVTYQNLGILLLAVAASWRGWKRPPSAWLRPACWLALGLSAAALMQKCTEASVTAASQRLWTSEEDALSLPTSFYAMPDYTITEAVPKIDARPEVPKRELDLRVLGGRAFGEVAAAQISLNTTTLVVLNVALFPWNHLYLDRTPARPDIVFRDEYRAAVWLTGGVHSIEYRFQPDPVWFWLRLTSWCAFLTLVLWYVAAASFTSSRRLQSGPTSLLAPTPNSQPSRGAAE